MSINLKICIRQNIMFSFYIINQELFHVQEHSKVRILGSDKLYWATVRPPLPGLRTVQSVHILTYFSQIVKSGNFPEVENLIFRIDDHELSHLWSRYPVIYFLVRSVILTVLDYQSRKTVSRTGPSKIWIMVQDRTTTVFLNITFKSRNQMFNECLRFIKCHGVNREGMRLLSVNF